MTHRHGWNVATDVIGKGDDPFQFQAFALE